MVAEKKENLRYRSTFWGNSTNQEREGVQLHKGQAFRVGSVLLSEEMRNREKEKKKKFFPLIAAKQQGPYPQSEGKRKAQSIRCGLEENSSKKWGKKLTTTKKGGASTQKGKRKNDFLDDMMLTTKRFRPQYANRSA